LQSFLRHGVLVTEGRDVSPRPKNWPQARDYWLQSRNSCGLSLLKLGLVAS